MAPAPLWSAWLVAALSCVAPLGAQEIDASRAGEPAAIARVRLPQRLRARQIKPGLQLAGVVREPVYAGACQVLPAGTSFQTEISSSKRTRNRRAVTLQNAVFTRPDASSFASAVEFLTIRAARASGSKALTSVVLIGLPAASSPCAAPASGTSSPPTPIPPDTRVHAVLLSALSAKRSGQGDSFLARTIDPIWSGDRIVLPAGAVLAGHVTSRKPPRWLHRSGQLRLGFRTLQSSAREPADIVASVAGVESDARRKLSVDREGAITPERLSKKSMMVRAAIAYAGGKMLDDLFEEGVKAALGAAVSGTAATYARYIGLTFGITFFLAQHGNDVQLPEYTEIEVTFGRGVNGSAATVVGGGARPSR